ncbi:unnamed protein product [Pleuronectes platessa]|uniref:Uncharacterized protein n=1 Tax=Pleuronectes platessa TaxID=8262 RepID=A0A9N7Z1G7_PLEPL|nr:unnamed protein product [Pleuronectes platessa]
MEIDIFPEEIRQSLCFVSLLITHPRCVYELARAPDLRSLKTDLGNEEQEGGGGDKREQIRAYCSVSSGPRSCCAALRRLKLSPLPRCAKKIAAQNQAPVANSQSPHVHGESVQVGIVGNPTGETSQENCAPPQLSLTNDASVLKDLDGSALGRISSESGLQIRDSRHSDLKTLLNATTSFVARRPSTVNPWGVQKGKHGQSGGGGVTQPSQGHITHPH